MIFMFEGLDVRRWQIALLSAMLAAMAIWVFSGCGDAVQLPGGTVTKINYGNYFNLYEISHGGHRYLIHSHAIIHAQHCQCLTNRYER